MCIPCLARLQFLKEIYFLAHNITDAIVCSFSLNSSFNNCFWYVKAVNICILLLYPTAFLRSLFTQYMDRFFKFTVCITTQSAFPMLTHILSELFTSSTLDNNAKQRLFSESLCAITLRNGKSSVINYEVNDSLWFYFPRYPLSDEGDSFCS